jgi:nicotinate dehydrogenase subunit A
MQGNKGKGRQRNICNNVLTHLGIGRLEVTITSKTVIFNGVSISVDPDAADMPALFFIRDQLKLMQTRYGCGSGSCGACAILVDDKAVTSCDVPISALTGKKVETAETLLSDDREHPIFKALIKSQAAQCGYCISGIAIRIESLLRERPLPSKDRVLSELDGHLCRCGAHLRILNAVEELLSDKEQGE